MLTRFKDQYFSYKGTIEEDSGEKNADDNSIAKGLFEAAFCADMCAAYIFEIRERCFWHAKYKGIYCNDGLVIFMGKLAQNELSLWLKSFERKVDTLVGGTFFQNTAKIWTPDKEVEEVNNGLVKQQWLDKVKSSMITCFLFSTCKWNGKMTYSPPLSMPSPITQSNMLGAQAITAQQSSRLPLQESSQDWAG
eukprot:7686063-Ditylum_brightwellii.AAC.1